MRPYWATWSARFRLLLQYRAAAIAGLTTQCFFGIVRVMIFEAFYRSSDAPQPMAYAEVVTYIWLGQSLFRMLPWDTDRELREMVRTGAVAYEMLRPVDIYSFWFSKNLAGRVAPALLRFVPMLPVSFLFGMRLPPTVGAVGAFLLALAGAVTLSCALSTLMAITLLWTISGDGVNRILPSVMFLASGMIIPLPLYPDWLQGFINVLPFRGLADLPFRLYSGNLPAASVVGVVAIQFAWALLLVVIGRRILARGLRRLVVQGG
jgi:ABC-2 type transport system permease protein